MSRASAIADKVGMAAESWRRFLTVKRLLATHDLGEVTRRLGIPPATLRRRRHPLHLGRAVSKALSPGPLRTRCLPVALVHYRLLVEQGLRPELVIGMPEGAESPDAHAWVEVEGIDVGPPPGRGDRTALARYGPAGAGG